MYKFIASNTAGNKIEFDALGGAYILTNISGLASPPATINTSSAALIDGASFNSAKAEMRTINLAFAIESKDVEASRIYAYKVFQIKRKVILYYKSSHRDVYIEGYVQNLDITHFEAKQIATVEILCPKPYWKSAEAVITAMSNVVGAFHFPFYGTETPNIVFGYLDASQVCALVNDGNVETGMIIRMVFRKAGISQVWITNYNTGDYFQLNVTDVAADTEIVITSMPGNKKVIQNVNGVETNIFHLIEEGSTWPILEPGLNEFTYAVSVGSAEDVEIQVEYNSLYEGI